MKLFIANTTKQRHIFTFRVLETGRLRQIPIEHGSQMAVLDGSTDEIEAVRLRALPYLERFNYQDFLKT